jgi:hypothetical protein
MTAEAEPTDAVVLRDLAHALERGGEPYGWVPNRLRTIADRLDALLAEPGNVAKVLEGFDKGVFVRDISHDHDRDWAIRALPYLVALGRLAKAGEPRGAPSSLKRPSSAKKPSEGWP